MNGFSETELPGRFDGFKPDGTPYPEQYQILIVAEKYQTGFDQPKLCAMYVDRKLAGLAGRPDALAPQSHAGGQGADLRPRLPERDRGHPGRLPAVFEVTGLEAVSDPNQIYELEGRLFKFGISRSATRSSALPQTFYKGPLDGGDRARLEGLVRHAVARFETDDDEGQQEEFRQLASELHAFLQLRRAGHKARRYLP